MALIFTSSAYCSASFDYYTVLHYEYESVKADKFGLENDDQQISTLHTIIDYELASNDATWAINLQAKINAQLLEDRYSTPAYRTRYPTSETKTFFLNMASIDYCSNNFALSVGRNSVDLDWLRGSIDSFIFFGTSKFVQVRAFWMLSYYDSTYNYHTEYTDINNNTGVSGIHLQSTEALDSFKLKAFYYSSPSKLYITGFVFDKETPLVNIRGSLTYADKLKGKKETLIHLNTNRSFGADSTIEVGYFKASKQGLYNMLKFGSHPQLKFYLNNSIGKHSAQNLYLQYQYSSEKVEIEIAAGATSYRAKYLQSSTFINVDALSYEIDLRARYLLMDNLMLEAGYMMLDIDRKDSLDLDQNLLTLRLSTWLP